MSHKGHVMDVFPESFDHLSNAGRGRLTGAIRGRGEGEGIGMGNRITRG